MLWNCRLDPEVGIQFQCREIQKVWLCHQAWLGECLQHAHLWQSDYHRTSNLKKKQISTKIKKIHDCELKSAFWCIVYLAFLRYQLISAHMLPGHGGFQLVAKIIRKLKSHMIPYKFKCSHWWLFALQSECCSFNQWEHLNL